MEALSINKKKSPEVLNVFSGIGFLALSIFIYFNSEGSIIEKWSKGISLFGILFFVGVIVINLVKVFKSKAAMWIDDDGFTYASSAFSAGKIHWDNVREIDYDNDNQLVIVKLKEDASYLSQFKGWKLKILERNKAKYGSPALIYSESLDLPIKEIYQILQHVFSDYKRKGHSL